MSAAEVRELLRQAALVSARVSTALQDSGLTVDRWRVLAHVAGCAERPPAMSEVAEELGLSPATTTRTVDALVEIGAVFREVAVGDRRRVVLRPSRPGIALLASVDPLVAVAAADGPVAAGRGA
ncbi:MarR family winged helix-turn-helix transcriptional regulator [Kineococcus gynurae]|uniref:MarR family winged helix-turn-helix transcriptional regulator n=1 Tax=Kineococcus gynurae TaxID=452979 RepID=A0ABV5LWD9_9ACTN